MSRMFVLLLLGVVPCALSATVADAQRLAAGFAEPLPFLEALKLLFLMIPVCMIAFVLAPLLEQSLRQSLAMSPDGAMIFLQRPGTALMLAACAVLVALMFRRTKRS